MPATLKYTGKQTYISAENILFLNKTCFCHADLIIFAILQTSQTHLHFAPLYLLDTLPYAKLPSGIPKTGPFVFPSLIINLT